MFEKIKTLVWFLKRPSFYHHATNLILRKFKKNYDSPFFLNSATAWAKSNAVSASQALEKLELKKEGEEFPRIKESLLEEASILALDSKVKMGGSGDLHLIYAATKLINAKRAIETGVAYGWSSLAILSGLETGNSSKLISIDMPYPKMNNEDFVGIVIPKEFRKNWKLFREPDKKGIEKAISTLVNIDICHYDSDKSYFGRCYGYPLLWNALVEGGVFISDDIQDNLAFKEFIEAKKVNFAVTEYKGKYIGIARKASIS